jgi:hypothetical protein
MAHDPRDQLWNAVFETFYDSFYEELIADRIVFRWQVLDEITKVLVALTASGSAIAGWALWNEPDFKIVWAIIAGIAAILALVHSALLVPSKIKGWTKIQRQFCVLRVDLDTLRNKMKIDPNFSVTEISKDLDGLRQRYRVAIQDIPNDILMTEKFQINAQTKLDQRLVGEIIPN